ncbi:MAG TPA: DUF2950 domain-containing protein [Vicinamibacterales bacterium]|nr:DUF2950 domain-containing protein [Vicinamibacterales bacterium]
MTTKTWLTTVAAIALSAPLVLSQTPAKPAAPQTPAPRPPAATATKPPAGAKAFATTKEAADALIQAASAFDVDALVAIVGPDGKDLVTTEDPVRDKSYAAAFAALAHEAQLVVVDPANPARATLQVGADHWPLPIPLVRLGGKWYFDANKGRDEILFRRVGTNELDAIEICRGFVEAQKDYALDLHDNSGVHQYAQRIISSPGKQDGLYWKNADGSAGGPISEAVAKAIEEGYDVEKASAYHGYYFHVLKAQGPAAHLGEMDYVINGLMIGGFALIATPAEYGVTGVQTFIVSYEGVVYQKDLGPDSVALAKKIDRYNPDKTWTRVNDGWLR